MFKDKIKKINLKKKHKKKNQSQPILAFRTCDLSHEPAINTIENKP